LTASDPSGSGPPRLTRREFFSRWTGGRRDDGPTGGEGETIPGRFTLGSLDALTDEDLMRLIPVLRSGWKVEIGADAVAYHGETGDEGIVPLTVPQRAALLRFDGTGPLDKVAAAVETELGMPEGSAVPIVREIFLLLARREVFHPDVPPDRPEFPRAES
jgi:hypothetical protein